MRNIPIKIRSALCGFWSDDSGQDLIENALVAAIIALGAIVAMNSLAATIASAFSTIGTKLTSSL